MGEGGKWREQPRSCTVVVTWIMRYCLWGGQHAELPALPHRPRLLLAHTHTPRPPHSLTHSLTLLADNNNIFIISFYGVWSSHSPLRIEREWEREVAGTYFPFLWGVLYVSFTSRKFFRTGRSEIRTYTISSGVWICSFVYTEAMF